MILDDDWEARHPHLTSSIIFLAQAIGFLLMFGFICLVVLLLTGGW